MEIISNLFLTFFLFMVPPLLLPSLFFPSNIKSLSLWISLQNLNFSTSSPTKMSSDFMNGLIYAFTYKGTTYMTTKMSCSFLMLGMNISLFIWGTGLKIKIK